MHWRLSFYIREALATKSSDLRLIPRIHMAEGESWLVSCLLTSTYAPWTHTHLKILKRRDSESVTGFNLKPSVLGNLCMLCAGREHPSWPGTTRVLALCTSFPTFPQISTCNLCHMWYLASVAAFLPISQDPVIARLGIGWGFFNQMVQETDGCLFFFICNRL